MNDLRVARIGLALVALLVAGCLKVESTLDRDGGGTVALELSKLNKDGDERVRAQLVSPGVKLISAEYSDADKVGKYKVSFTDVEKLRTTPMFRTVRFQHKDADKEIRTIAVAIPRRPRNENKKDLPDEDFVLIDLTLELPGPVVETNGTRDGETKVRWPIRVKDMQGLEPFELEATYKVPPLG